MKTIRTLLVTVTLVFSALVIADEGPTEFVTQVLEPSGGKILRPKDWFYAELHKGPVLRWVISPENVAANHGHYTTGVALSVIPHVKDLTGRSAEQYLRDFITDMKQQATRVIKACEEQKGEMFTRVCLETEKGDLHVLYSVFWGNEGMDLAVSFVASARKDQWQTYASTFDKMGEFELFDPKRSADGLSSADETVIDQDEAPSAFITQVLQPTGGTILRPKNWFYAENHQGPSYRWSLSREDPAAGKPYQTGLSIQTWSGFKANTGNTSEQTMRAWLDNRAKAATKVISTCEPKNQGAYMFLCLETEERGFHIRYSSFWGSHDEDIAVLVTAGAPTKLWGKYAPTFDKMAEFKLPDPKRFER